MFIDSAILTQIGCCEDGLKPFNARFPNGHTLYFILNRYEVKEAAWLVINLYENGMLPAHYVNALPSDSNFRNLRYLIKNFKQFLNSITKDCISSEIDSITVRDDRSTS